MKIDRNKYVVCKTCVMDTSDENIKFDKDGICDYCKNFDKNIKKNFENYDFSKKKIIDIAKKIKNKSNNKYDCLIGISGGVDSSYLAYFVKKELKLNPIVIHVDTGWNSLESANNIEKIIDGLELDLETIVIPWKEMRDLQLSFFKAQHPNLDIPQDHAIFASLYNYAIKNNIKYILTGGNFSTECIREPLEWAYHASDVRHIKDIHKKFGEAKLLNFPLCDIFTYKIYYRFFKGLKVVQPLNFIEFNKEKSMELLKNSYGWIKYDHKHYESRFTKFYEGYWLLKKFGYDKRKAHFSSLILTGQMTREDALNKLSKPPFDQKEIDNEFNFVCKKLNISEDELKKIMNESNKSFKNYKSSYYIIQFFVKLLRIFGMENRLIR
ncbi:N-acetyl sugar amidotransferase [Candidatus Pelagibacter sp.]|nr:N-acetyl sugar amidotransferase [Candidatus Pelagibacter sp.]